MIEFSDVKIRYGRREVVRGASFRAENGAVTVLLGKNGSGKSSLLRAAAGTQRYTGDILLDGVSLADLPRRERAKRLGYMPQTPPETELTVEELLLCGLAPHRGVLEAAGNADRAAAKEILDRTGLTVFGDCPVAALSGGERQRAYFAMLLAQNAPNLILDEPTANLDTEYRQMVYDFLRDARQAGKAVLVVMHHIGESRAVADRICVLRDGEIRFDGPVSDFTESLRP